MTGESIKTIVFEPLWKSTLTYRWSMQFPPQGYQFVMPSPLPSHVFSSLSKKGYVYKIYDCSAPFLPLPVIKAYLEKFKPLPTDHRLIYAVAHLVFRREPWVLDMQTERFPVLIGGMRYIRYFRKLLLHLLSSPYCRKIIYWIEAGKRDLVARLGMRELEDKVEVVYWGVTKRNIHRVCRDDKVKLLFVGSGNIPTTLHFHHRGGKEVVEAFLELNRRYDNLELTIRSCVPSNVRERLRGTKNVRILECILSSEELEEEFRTADIFVHPTRDTPGAIYPEVMSYGLPIVTTDIWANAEFVKHGRTGLLVHDPTCSYSPENLDYFESPSYHRSLSQVNHEVVSGLVEKLSFLIEHPKVRRQMGENAKREVDEGKFSMVKKNERLRKIFDKATSL